MDSASSPDVEERSPPQKQGSSSGNLAGGDGVQNAPPPSAELDEEAEDTVRTLNLNRLALNDAEKVERLKEALLQMESKVQRMTSVFCDKDPTFSKTILQKHSDHLQELELLRVAPEHLRVLAGMPHLRSLRVDFFDYKANSDVEALQAEFADLPRAHVGEGLRELSLRLVPWQAVACLLEAHRLTLEKFRLDKPVVRDEMARRYLVPLAVSLPRLREMELVLDDLWDIDEPDPTVISAQELRELKARVGVSLLTAARDSLEELYVHELCSPELLVAAQGLPRLRKLAIWSCSFDLDETRLVLAEPNLCPLRSLVTPYLEEAVPRAASRLAQVLIAAYKHVVEDLSISDVRPEDLVAVQSMPRLHRLHLGLSAKSLKCDPVVARVQGADPQDVRVLEMGYMPSETAVCLLNWFGGTVEELSFGRPCPAEVTMILNNSVPRLQRLLFSELSWDADTPLPDACGELARLEKITVHGSASARILARLLTASRTSLREVEVHQAEVDILPELQRLPQLRILTLGFLRTSTVPLECVPVPPGQLDHDGGLQVLALRGRPLCRMTLQSFLQAHKHSLEEVDVSEVAGEHLLTLLGMPRLRKLWIRGSVQDLESSSLPEVAAGGAVRWLRLGYHHTGLPLSAARALLIAYRHSLEHLELDVDNETAEDNGEEFADGLWPPRWQGLHGVLQECGLERLSRLNLNRLSYRSQEICSGRCPEQLQVLLRVFPNTIVTCSRCYLIKKPAWPLH